MRITSLCAALVCGLALTACGGMESNEAAAVAAPEQAHDALVMDAPIPAGCPPTKGNEKNVGAPCSKRGGECRGTLAPVCSVDATTAAPVAFCTRPCTKDANCGRNAKCRPSPDSPILKGCVPSVCLGIADLEF